MGITTFLLDEAVWRLWLCWAPERLLSPLSSVCLYAHSRLEAATEGNWDLQSLYLCSYPMSQPLIDPTQTGKKREPIYTLAGFLQISSTPVRNRSQEPLAVIPGLGDLLPAPWCSGWGAGPKRLEVPPCGKVRARGVFPSTRPSPSMPLLLTGTKTLRLLGNCNFWKNLPAIHKYFWNLYMFSFIVIRAIIN